jgi:hypothetical protein
MKDRSRIALPLAALITSTMAMSASAQHGGMGMTMSKTTLLLAQLDAASVVGGSQSHSTGTAAFLLDPIAHNLIYTVTYQGLDGNGAGSIGLYNFGPGKTGDIVRIICGRDSAPCPNGSSATVSGRLEPDAGRPMNDNLITEFDNGRVYVEITETNGTPAIRGQLSPNTAMTRTANYVARLRPAAGSTGKGSGTAVLSEVFLPGGKTAVFYTLTVANTSGSPTGVSLAGRSPTTAQPIALPLPAHAAPHTATGGTVTNQFRIALAEARTEKLLAARLSSLATTPTDLVVATSHVPKGELSGTLMLVR